MDLIAHHDFRKRYIFPLSHYYYNIILIYLNHLPNHIITQILQYLPVSQLYVLSEAVVYTAILLIPINYSNTALLVIWSIQIVAVETPYQRASSQCITLGQVCIGRSEREQQMHWFMYRNSQRAAVEYPLASISFRKLDRRNTRRLPNVIKIYSPYL